MNTGNRTTMTKRTMMLSQRLPTNQTFPPLPSTVPTHHLDSTDTATLTSTSDMWTDSPAQVKALQQSPTSRLVSSPNYANI